MSVRLVLETLVKVPDGAGGFAAVWQPRGTLWAEMAAGAGGEAFRGEVTEGRVPWRIRVRAAPEGVPSRPRPDERLRLGTRVFVILSVGEAPGGRYLTLFAREEVAA
ncbi:MAG: head-tail adaptor protein [Gemmobacter sp.]